MVTTSPALDRKQHRLQQETEIIINNPEVGMNIDQEFLVDARTFLPIQEQLEYRRAIGEKDIDIQYEQLRKAGKVDQLLQQRQQRQIDKMTRFREYINGFQGNLKHIRVNPAGESSPLAPSQSIHSTENGYDVGINPLFIEQLQLLKRQGEDMTVVVQFFDHRRGVEKASNVPETAQEIQQYADICENLIAAIGEDIQIELGNETNITRETGPMFKGKLQHGTKVDPTEYAKFYCEVARKIKVTHPTTRLALAGIVNFDPDYLQTVLTEVKRYEQDNGLQALIDTVSFHPYRKNPEEASVEVQNGHFIAPSQTYDQQLEQFLSISHNYRTDINATVGEINFNFSDLEGMNKLRRSIDLTSQRQVLSFIYPGINVNE